MKVGNQVDTAGGGGKYIDSREIKTAAKEGVKLRLYGDAEMGYSYFQKDGDKVKIVRSTDFPTMENPTDGYQGAEQKPAQCFYIVAWNYGTDAPCLLTLDKKTLINPVLAIENDSDLAGATDYDLKFTFDDKKEASEKYAVTRLDKTDLTDEQTKALKAFAKDTDLAKHAAGEAEGDVSPF